MSGQPTSYAQNVVNLNEMKERIITFGLRYAPVNADYSVPGLETLITNSQQALSLTNAAINAQKNTTGIFKMGMAIFTKIITRSFNILAICGASEQIVQQGRAILRDVRGQRIALPIPPEPPPGEGTEPEPTTNVRHIGTMDFKLESMGRYVQFITEVGEYNPNEPDLKVLAMTEFLAELQAINADAKRNEALAIAARRNRDVIMFIVITGLYDVQKGVKRYTKAVFGPNSTEYISIRGFRFTNKKLEIVNT